MFSKFIHFQNQTFELCAIISNPTKKRPYGRFRLSWLGRTDSNHDKENQNLLSYH